jgi:Protein of unknown function (DUF3592)
MKVWEHPLAMVGIGVVLLVFGGYMGVQGERSRHWPIASGIITESSVQPNYSVTGRRRRSRSARITYRYPVNGTFYTSDLISYGKGLFDNEYTQVRLYPQGARVEVRYDPGNPARAVLDPGAGLVPLLALLAGVGCCSFAFWRARTA